MDWRSWFIPGRSAKKGPIDSLRDPLQDDLDRLEQLKQGGSKLNLPHPVRNFLLLPSEKDARQAMERLAEEGYSCQLRAVADGRWQVIAVIQMVPRAGVVTRMREQLDEVARTLEGEYAGWDAPFVY